MTTIELRYNPFKAETILTVDGKETHLNCFGTGEGYHLADWKNNFFPQLIKKLNKGPGSSCAVIFYGLQEDYNEVLPVHAAYCEQNKDIIVHLDYGTLPPVTLAEKEALVQKAISPGEVPIDALTSTDFAEKVNSILHNQTPAFKYLEPAEKLLRIITDYRQLFDGLGLKNRLEKDLTDKQAALDKAVADIEEKRKLEARGDFDELEQKIAASKKDIIEAVYEKSLNELETVLQAMQEEKKPQRQEFVELMEKGMPELYRWYSSWEEQGRPFNSDSINKLLEVNISKQTEDYVFLLNEYVTLFPGKPSLEDLGVDINIKNVSNDPKMTEAKKESSETSVGIPDISFATVATVAVVGIATILLTAIGGSNNEKEKPEKKALLKTADDAAKENALKLKDHFSAELDKINAALIEKIAEARKEHEAAVAAAAIPDDTVDVFKSGIAAVEKQIEWLAGYTRGLDSVLEV